MTKEDKEKRIEEIETEMQSASFWDDKTGAQALLKELSELKEEAKGGGRYDKGDAILTIFSGAGGDDAEDFSHMLLEMYLKYCRKKAWDFFVLHKSENDHGGYRNITLEIKGKGVYGTLKNESGVHRLVRVSPFSSKQLRHTSFSLVEVVPELPKADTNISIPESELDVTVAKAGGPGGQNVNKRETAVRMVHIPTKLSVHVATERSLAQNKERALDILKGKIYKIREEERKAKEKGFFISKTTNIEWGSQIRSYVLHPYKMVKDHRTNVETTQVDKVLAGEIDQFIEAEKDL